ncbi:MAG: putative CRISPR-associated protein [Desulfurococcales archaeon]|nr:putative CRISPR-associated protein [Desulfurococcales archaeon]
MTVKVNHIVVSGTSILRNAARQASGDIAKILGDCGVARPLSDVDAECMRHAVQGSEVYREALDRLRLDPCRVSAEVNAMAPWLGLCGKGLDGPSRIDRVVILHTDTGAGMLAAKVLAHYLREVVGSAVAGARRVDGFGIPGSMARGLVQLAKAIKEEAAHGDVTLLNVTGGFKPESGYAILAGIAHYKIAAAYYIHEAFRDTVVIPLLPASIVEDLPRASSDMIPVRGRRELELLAHALEPTGLTSSSPPSVSSQLVELIAEVRPILA